MAVAGPRKLEAGKAALRKRTSLASIAVPGGQNFVVLGAGELPVQTVAAVGVTSTLGTVAAAHSGTFGTHALDEVAGLTGISPRNIQIVVDAVTRQPIPSSGKRVFALLQTENAADGHTLSGATPNRAQLSFVRFNAAGNALEAVPGADIGGKTIQFEGFERAELRSLDELDFSEGIFEDLPEQTGGGGGGITESEHESLDTLVHKLAEDSYTEHTYSGAKLTSSVTWTSVAKTLKIREKNLSYTGSKVTGITVIQYDGAGAPVSTVTKALSYTGAKLTSETSAKS